MYSEAATIITVWYVEVWNGLKLSTVFHHAEYQEHLSSDGVPTGKWVLTDTAQGSQLGTLQRVQEKEIKGNSLLNLFLATAL